MSGFKLQNILNTGLVMGFAALAASADAMTLNINDGSTYTLSAAVAEVYAAADGPDVINLNVAALLTPDGQIVLDKPITINGNANSRPAPDSHCDILADQGSIQQETTADAGQLGKAYLEISAPGTVTINNLKIHPSANGKFGAAAKVATIVAGIRMWNPVGATDVGNYNLTNVLVSGSEANSGNAFIPLDSGADLYNGSNKKWGGFNGAQHVNVVLYGTIQADNGTGAGIFNIVLDHCNAGIGFGGAVNINSTGGTTLIKGGIYGHSGRDGIRVASTSVTLQGTHDDRLRVVRSTNITAGNSHGVEIAGEVTLMEYVDSASVQTANAFSIQGGTKLDVMRFCRALGKFDAGANEAFYVSGTDTTIGVVEDSTFVGSGSNFNPMNVPAGVADPFTLTNSIFTSENNGTVIIASPAAIEFVNCALPTDGFVAESLANPPFTGAGTPTAAPVISLSPNYMLRLADYDWSEAQGAGKPGNAVGNANVLRPSNPAYQTASSTSGPLNGGAGAPAAGIDPSEWMLMQ